ncbi:MAG TPA: toll/interleukin-1 receptor domain-containing protein [Pyrinomonadaceae bacterium]|nr:toll/interleukin-1 receptor domain-containing protein [Pyrinomonadaceae bacterium]
MKDSDNPEDSSGEIKGMPTFAEILKLPRDEAIKAAGVRGWEIARLNQLLNEVLANTSEPPAKPFIIFVSYRWESQAHQAWVKRLVNDLQARGYDVYLDQNIQAEREEPLPVPELISLLARSNRFLMVLSEGYLERIEPNDERGSIKDGWVWDEYQTAIHLANLGRIKSWLVAWRSGKLPDWVKEEQVWDFRDDAQYEAVMNAAFPPQMVRIIGVRPDGSARIVGPIERVKTNVVGRQLESTGEFDHFVIENL